MAERRAATTTSFSAIINDWQVNGVARGLQRHAVHGDRERHVAEHAEQPRRRPTSSARSTITGNIGAAGTWFDTTAFAQPTGVRFGNTGRNQFYGPGGWNLDFSLFRSFPIGGTRRLEYRLQAGNIFNHPVYANPNGDITSGDFGQITGIANQYPERQIRMGLRFSF